MIISVRLNSCWCCLLVSLTVEKRFHYPGPNRRGTSNEQPANNFSTVKPAKTQGLAGLLLHLSACMCLYIQFHVADFESDLQEVWSVRKNIHHQGGKQSSATTSHAPAPSSLVQTAAAHYYSRHGAIAAQQSCSAPVLPKSNKDPIAKCVLYCHTVVFSLQCIYKQWMSLTACAFSQSRLFSIVDNYSQIVMCIYLSAKALSWWCACAVRLCWYSTTPVLLTFLGHYAKHCQSCFIITL